MTEGCCAACSTADCTQSMLSPFAREFPLPPTTAAAATADSVSSANNAHACDCEWVQPDSSSWDERKQGHAENGAREDVLSWEV